MDFLAGVQLGNCFDFSRQTAAFAAATEHAKAPGLPNIPKKNGPPNVLGGPHKKQKEKLLDKKSFPKLVAPYERLHGPEAAEEILNLAILIDLLGGENRLR